MIMVNKYYKKQYFNRSIIISRRQYSLVKSILPLRSAIMEILSDRNGEMLDTDLTVALNSRYGANEFSIHEINKALIALETQGIVHVQVLTKYKKKILAINRSDQMYLGVEED